MRLTQVPLGRVGELREVDLLAAYLASPAAAYVTGQTLAIDGGSTLWPARQLRTRPRR